MQANNDVEVNTAVQYSSSGTHLKKDLLPYIYH